MNRNKKTYLITGGAGFVGHHFVEHILKNSEDDVIVVDSLTYSGSLNRLRDIDLSCGLPTSNSTALDKVKVYTWDLRQPAEPHLVSELESVTHILHLAAESHVDNSIDSPLKFIESNVIGTHNVLMLARELPNLELMVTFSTDEVYGPAPLMQGGFGYGSDGLVDGGGACQFIGFAEDAPHNPKNPYAATKSAAEMLTIAYANTYGIPCIRTNGMNIIGERQHPEKYLPLVINKVLSGEKLYIHGTPDKKQAGMRTYIHARNVADACLHLVNNQDKLDTREAENFNICGQQELDNLEFAWMITRCVNSSLKQNNPLHYEIVDFHSSRPGHDLRYALDGSKMKSLGWEPPKSLEESVHATVRWYLENREWLDL